MLISASLVALASAAPLAGADGTEVQAPEEQLFLSFPFKSRAEFTELDVTVYPQRGVATVTAFTESGRSKDSGGLDVGVNYAAHIPRRPLGGGFDFRIPSVGQIVGEFAASRPASSSTQVEGCEGPQPSSEAGHFVGLVSFRLGAGKPTRRASVEASVLHTARLHCGTRFEPRPGDGLFDYVSRSLPFSGSVDVLVSMITSGSQTSEFIATKEFGAGSSTSFEARALEWLPGRVATARFVQFGAEAPGRFKVNPPAAAKPATAVLRPPSPFAGTATFRRKTGTLTGSLSFKVFGRRIQLATPKSQPILCVTPLGSALGTCTKPRH